MTVSAGGTASILLQELPDGSWIGNASWGGRLLTDGGIDEQPMLRRLSARLSAIPDRGRPESVKITRIPRSGEGEEREQNFVSFLA